MSSGLAQAQEPYAHHPPWASAETYSWHPHAMVTSILLFVHPQCNHGVPTGGQGSWRPNKDPYIYLVYLPNARLKRSPFSKTLTGNNTHKIQ